MRRRVKRALIALGGVIIVVAAIAFMNYNLSRADLWKKYETMRMAAERTRDSMGLPLLPWRKLMDTSGSLRSGAKFQQEVLDLDGQHVDLIAFMVPLNQFRNMTEFLVLPVPIECYFCRMPPASDVVYVQMKEGETVDYVYNEPVLINGRITLHGEPGTKFFYRIEDATLDAGDPSAPLTQREIPPEHTAAPSEHQKTEDDLDPGFEPPTGKGVE